MSGINVQEKITVQTFYTGDTSKEKKANINIIDDESYLKNEKELKDFLYLKENELHKIKLISKVML